MIYTLDNNVLQYICENEDITNLLHDYLNLNTDDSIVINAYVLEEFNRWQDKNSGNQRNWEKLKCNDSFIVNEEYFLH